MIEFAVGIPTAMAVIVGLWIYGRRPTFVHITFDLVSKGDERPPWRRMRDERSLSVTAHPKDVE